MIINIPQEDYNKCLIFSNSVVDTNIDCYTRRNQNNLFKIKQDILVGKLAEFATYRFLVSKGRTVQEPDCQVYASNRKSFSADLTDGVNKYHVKCMKKETAARFGLSWSFQIEDRLTSRPEETDVLVLCEIDGTVVDIKTIVKANKVMELYTKPVLRKLWNIKKVLMWDDIYNSFGK